jgi:hypothetical protein
MTLRAYYRRDLALAQLETALRLFGERKDLASVITLAGAADEIFGKLLTASGGESSLASLTKAVAAIHEHLYGEPGNPAQIARRANLARNSLKHWDEGDAEIIKFDLEVEASDMLNRAIDNYWSLEKKLSPAMEAFQRETFVPG